MLINFTNHPSNMWSEEQKRSAATYGDICDMAFPAIDAEAGHDEIVKKADEYSIEIMKMSPDAVLCQGEMSFTYALVDKLKNAGISCLAACSKREVMEEQQGDATVKKSVFKFVRFREY